MREKIIKILRDRAMNVDNECGNPYPMIGGDDEDIEKIADEIITLLNFEYWHANAYEWHNHETGHCYVDYIPHPGQNECDGYVRKPLFYLSGI